MPVPRALLWTLAAATALVPWLGEWPFLWRALDWMQSDGVIHVKNPALDLWQQAAFWALACLLIAALAWGIREPWLGAAVALGVVELFFPVTAYTTYQDTVILAVAVVGIVALRQHGAALAGPWLRLLALSGGLVAVVILVQWAGLDPFYGGAWRGDTHGVPPGPFAVAALAAGYAAVTGLLLPWAWVRPTWRRWPLTVVALLGLPIVALAIALTHSATAVLAFAVGLVVRARSWWVAGAVTLVVGTVLVQHGVGTLALRACAAGTRLADLIDAPIFGFGLGAWGHHPLVVAQGSCAWDGPGAWDLAHNEVVQWLYERGLAGAVVLVGWLVSLRARLAHPVLGPALAALAVFALAWPALHSWALGLVALSLVGLPADASLSTGA